jgi:N-acetylglucosamine-6-sulfatase
MDSFLHALTISGGYPKFVEQGLNDNYLPVWLQEAGYNTYYTGKLFNSLNVDNYNTPHPRGFTSNEFLLDPTTYTYINSTFQRNQDPPVQYPGTYSTDVVAEKTYAYINDAATAGKPFFIVAAPIAPHATQQGEAIWAAKSPVSADRHKDLFKNATVPRNAGFNPNKVSENGGV